jgi:hypothetical protein
VSMFTPENAFRCCAKVAKVPEQRRSLSRLECGTRVRSILQGRCDGSLFRMMSKETFLFNHMYTFVFGFFLVLFSLILAYVQLVSSFFCFK